VGVTEAVANGEGDWPGVGKFVSRGVGAGMNSRRTILSLVGVAAAVPVCDPMFVFAVVFAVVFAPVCVVTGELLLVEPLGRAVIPLVWLVPICAPAFVPVCVPMFVFAPIFVTLRAVVPVCGATAELPLEPLCPATVPVGAARLLLPVVPVRGVCARLKGNVATHITITPSVIDVIRFILFSLRPSRPLFATIFRYLKYPARAEPRYCARAGFFSPTAEVIGAPSFEIGWSY
jgi:hypothetical protein